MSSDDWYLWCIAGYVCGSIPFALLLGWWRGIDVRKAGSGNVGATNVGRLLGKKWGVLCFSLDVLKGFLPVFIAGWAMGLLKGSATIAEAAALSTTDAWRWLAVALTPVIGHVFPVWLKFKGGKGVATGFGVLLGVWPVLTFAAGGALLVWLAMAQAFRYVGLASVAAAMSLPLSVYVGSLLRGRQQDLMPFYIITVALAAVVIARHRGNLARTLAGTEPKLGQKRQPSAPDVAKPG